MPHIAFNKWVLELYGVEFLCLRELFFKVHDQFMHINLVSLSSAGLVESK